MHLTLFQMLALLRDAPSDAATLMERLRDMDPDRAPSVPAFYRHMRRADEEGWVRVEGLDEGEEGPGRPGRIYGLTRAGREAVACEARRLRGFTELALEGEVEGEA